MGVAVMQQNVELTCLVYNVPAPAYKESAEKPSHACALCLPGQDLATPNRLTREESQ